MSTPLITNGMATVYENETPFSTDVLRCGLYKMVDIACLSQTVLGTGLNNPVQFVDLPCAPISPPGLQVTIGVGRVYAFVNYLATAWGDLNSDTTANHQLYKQGILLDPLTFNTPAPGGGGNSIIYLIQAQFEEIDLNLVSRPYFNPSNPAAPVYTSADDTRQQTINIQIKAGAASGSPTPPTPDAGFTGLYYIQVANGQTSIVTGNITQLTTAPFITESLPQKAKTTTVQTSGYNYSVDTGSVNTYVVTLNPAPASYAVGLQVFLKITNANTGASTLNVNSLGAQNISLPTGNPINVNDLIVGQLAFLIYDGTQFQLQNPLSGIASEVPVGTQLDFAGTVIPSGYLLANGAAVSRATYTNLFSKLTFNQSATLASSITVTGLSDTSQMFIGMPVTGTGIQSSTTIASIINSTSITISAAATITGSSTLIFYPWGAGDQSTTFNLPNSSSTFSYGYNGTSRLVGESGGAETTSQIVNHSHNYNETTTSTVGSGATAAPYISGSGVLISNSSVATSTSGTGSSMSILNPFNVYKKIIKY